MCLRRLSTASALILALAVGGDALAGSGRKAVPRSEGGQGAGARAPSRGGEARAPASAPRRTSEAPVRVSGRASYGHGGAFVPGWPYDPWYPGYGSPWGWSAWWGWGPYGVWPYAYGYVGGGPVWGVDSRDPASDPTPGTVETDVTPRDAIVRVDGEEFGFARDFNGRWDVLRLAPGIRVVEFSKDGYRTFRAVVDVRPARTYRIERHLDRGEGLDPASDAPPAPAAAPARSAGSPAPAAAAVERGFLRFRVEPGDAAVYLDGSFLAKASELKRLRGAIPVAAGLHRVEIVHPGFTAWTGEVDVEAGGPAASVEVRLETSP